MPLCRRAFLDEVVREPVQLGYSEWSPAPVATPPRSEQQMSPLGGGLVQASGEWGQGAGTGTGSPAEQPYTNGKAGQYARPAATSVGAGRYADGGPYGGQQLPPAASTGQQVRVAFDGRAGLGGLGLVQEVVGLRGFECKQHQCYQLVDDEAGRLSHMLVDWITARNTAHGTRCTCRFCMQRHGDYVPS